MRWTVLLCLTLLPSTARADPVSAVRLAYADAQTLPPGLRSHVRYLDLSGIPLDERKWALLALWYQTNAISRNSDIVRPILLAGSLLRVSLPDYGWSRSVWERLADHDPYFHERTTRYYPAGSYTDGTRYPAGNYSTPASASWLPAQEAAGLIALTQSAAPVVRADWFFVQTIRQLSLGNRQTGVGYYDWLGIKSRKDFERIIKLSEKDSLDIGKEMRAAVLRSGVATQNRQIVRLQALTGGSWATLDVDSSEGKTNAIRNLGRGEMAHKAEEHFGVLPNGLFCFLLCDNQGALQNTAPDFIGSDDSPLRTGRDPRIHVGLSCLRCHVEGLRPINDWVRQTLRLPLGIQAVDAEKLVAFRRQYFSNLDRQLVRDRQLFQESLYEANGLKSADNARAVARLYDLYVERDRMPEDAARELGVTAPVLLQALKAHVKATGRLPPELAGYLQEPPVGIRVEQWERVYPEVQRILRDKP